MGDQLVSELQSNLMKMFAKSISAMEETEKERIASARFLQIFLKFTSNQQRGEKCRHSIILKFLDCMAKF